MLCGARFSHECAPRVTQEEIVSTKQFGSTESSDRIAIAVAPDKSPGRGLSHGGFLRASDCLSAWQPESEPAGSAPVRPSDTNRAPIGGFFPRS